jgi:hypothetical protein
MARTVMAPGAGTKATIVLVGYCLVDDHRTSL